MAENSGISWTDMTFNPWIGCTKVSPACDNCYAETWDDRFRDKNGGAPRWGARAARSRTGVKNWNRVLRWNREAGAAGRKAVVFCASLADVFDNHKSIAPEWRSDLWSLIGSTQNLAWMLLTKRPQNIARYLPSDWGDNGYANVALGASVENMTEAARRIPALLAVPAAGRFLSMEPLVEKVILPEDALGAGRIDYIIAGGESGTGARPADPDWFRSARDQASNARIAFHFKQWGEFDASGSKVGVDEAGTLLDGRAWADRLPIAA